MTEKEFEQEIKEYEDTMFGLKLYQESSPEWVRKAQEWHYNNIKRRGENALKEARSILSDIEAGKNIQAKIKCFEWPMIIKDMRFRIDVMLGSYKSLFPERPREKSLSEEEIIALQNDAMKRITLGDVWP